MKNALKTRMMETINMYSESTDSRQKARYEHKKEYLESGFLEQDLDAMKGRYNPRHPYQKSPSGPSGTTRKVTQLEGWDLPIGLQRGGSSVGIERPSFANSFLTLLSLEIKSHGKEPDTFVENAEDTIKDMGQVPLVKEFIGKLFDEIKIDNTEGYTFKPFKTDISALEHALHENFSESEISVLKEFSAPTVFYSAVPEEYEGILGEGAYSLSGPGSANAEEVDLHGVGEDIVVTKEERATLEKGGIPLGALVFLYFVCLKMSNSTA
jgi:hypothetical protein